MLRLTKISFGTKSAMMSKSAIRNSKPSRILLSSFISKILNFKLKLMFLSQILALCPESAEGQESRQEQDQTLDKRPFFFQKEIDNIKTVD